MTAAETLLHGAIDYAGLFPPAALDLETTVRKYAEYRACRDAWALGRFVLPAAKVAEFADRWPGCVAEWPVSLLLGADYDAEMRLAVDCGLQLDVVECRPARLDDVSEIRRRMPERARLFVEVGRTESVTEALEAIARVDACAKLRTGGVTADAIPGSGAVAAFLVGCAQRGLCFKATAGLHHAVRGDYRLTYDPQSARACTHGFVNFFLASAAAQGGADEAQIAAMLDEQDRGSFSARPEALRWREHSFPVDRLREMRGRFAISFGSCSFEEPLAEMRSMGWIA